MLQRQVKKGRREAVLSCTTTAIILSGAAVAQTGPAEITWSGVVRDLRERTAAGGHTDFEHEPDHGFGHYAGSVAHFIDFHKKPLFSGGGHLVQQQSRDAQGRPIAPHLVDHQYTVGTGENPNQTQVILQDSRGRNAYEITWLSTTFNANGTSTWVYRVRELAGGRDLSHWNLSLPPGMSVQAGTTPGYDLGIDGSSGFYGIKWDVADAFSSGQFQIVLDGYYYGADNPTGCLAQGGNTPDTGAMFAPTANISDTGSPFNTDAMLMFNQGWNDVAGVEGPADNGGVQNAQTFAQWWEDAPGVNLSSVCDLTFRLEESTGNYVFNSATDPEYGPLGGFFPIDNELYGNSGGVPDHNFHFTFEAHGTFTYDEDADQFFHFKGDDDVWVFIDKKLAIDLGGVHMQQEQYIDLNRMGLVDGEEYSIDFYFAERHRTASNMMVTTNLLIEPVPLTTISTVFD